MATRRQPGSRWTGRSLGVLGLAVTLGGCATQSGPIFGEWQGRQPQVDPVSPTFITLVLHGRPGDTQGGYDIQAVTTQPVFGDVNNRQLTWSDRWTLTPSAGPGSAPLLVLHNLPSSQISRYVLLANGVLLPATPRNLPDTSPESRIEALRPVPTTSFGYGRV